MFLTISVGKHTLTSLPPKQLLDFIF